MKSIGTDIPSFDGTSATDKHEPDPIHESLDRATAFSDSPGFVAAFQRATKNPELRDQAVADARHYLESMGVRVPPDLVVTFTSQFPLGKPGPGFESFTVQATRCRSYWIKKLKGVGYELVQLCLGFEIRPAGRAPAG